LCNIITLFGAICSFKEHRMSDNALDLGIPPEQALRLVEWVRAGPKHPHVSQYKHGAFLNDLGNGEFTADFFGFALVGKFGEPRAALEQLSAASDDVMFAALFDVDFDRIQDIVVFIGSLQDYYNIGTQAIIAKIHNHYSASAGASPATTA
jgi:hypothetical protein